MTEYQQEKVPFPTPGRLKRELRLQAPTWWMIIGLIVFIIATWIPLYLIAQKRASFSKRPKIHYVQDMDIQPGFRPQEGTTLYEDGRATRTPVAGTMARGHLREDDHFHRGYHTVMLGSAETVEFDKSIPELIVVNESLLTRGRERYEIYCTVCHDSNGMGNGIVHQRALALKESKWVPPTNLLTQEIRDRPDGQLFQAIGDGVRNMPGYKSQITAEDRWAIVAHVRHLQSAQPVALVEPIADKP